MILIGTVLFADACVDRAKAQSGSFSADAGAEFEGDFATLWQTGVLTPLWAAPAAAAASRSPVPPLTPGRRCGAAAG